ncbi:protein RST1 isoform X2 [Phalaenopsis equestris]|uniref:protein RST1 isoform X2 n=1 Tax=Phalaenopsis equestris TaxID=78828 RepID=UPI0009E56D46|nr:protein RST1 isoform X2 [Phalaenopsis equestris]
MDNPYAALLEKTRLPQPCFQRFAVVSLFRLIGSTPGDISLDSPACLDAISQCLRSPSAAVVDQAVREFCRLVAAGDRIPTSVALIELQSALEGCEPRFAPVLVKGIGFLCRLAFRMDFSWGRRFNRVELHPFVKVISCCKESQEELIEQVLLFIALNKSLGINEVVRFLRPFMMFSVIWKTSACVCFFSRNLISAIASLSCSFPLETISILKLLAECLKYLPLTNEKEFLYIVTSAVHLVDAYVVVLQRTVDIEKEVTNVAQRCSLEVVSMLLSICAYFHRKPLGQVERVIEIARHLLLAQKELGLHYVFDFVNIVVSASVILTQVEFEHDQLSVLKLLILLMEWKTQELGTIRSSCSLNEELLIVFPVINLLSSPSKSIKSAVTHLLSLAERFVLNFMGVFNKAEVSGADFPDLIEIESIPLRLLHHLFIQGQQLSYRSYSFYFTCDNVNCDIEKYHEPLYWISWLREHLLSVEKVKPTQPPQLSAIHPEGVNLLLGSIFSSLVISPAFHTSAVDFLVVIGREDPKLGMTMFQAALFYINILFKFESNSSRILLRLLEMLPSLVSHSAMVQIIVQTILPMLHKDAKPSLRAVALRLLCKAWAVSDRVFENLQDVLNPKILSNIESVREVCISVAASIRDVCKQNPDRGVDLILSSCIESEDSTVKALGLQSLSSLCEADVVDFYTAWEVVAKHVNSYAEEPIVAAGLVNLLRWGAVDVEAYPDNARSVLLILWKVGTFKSYSSEALWVKARTFAFQSMMHYEIVKFQEIIPDFKEKTLQCFLNEYNAEVLEAIKEFEIKIINFEHINRRRSLKERRPLGYKVEKLLDVFPQALFSPGAGNHYVNAREFPGAALLSYVFSPTESHGLSNDALRIHASFEKALMEIAEALLISRNIVIALLALESWKTFIRQWMKALVTSADTKCSSIESDNSVKSACDILKICCKVAVDAVPQASVNIALAIGSLCLVVPSSCYAVISSASDFLLKWLVDCKHEHRQWSSAISLGVISNCFHATDKMQRMNVITVLMKEAFNSKSQLVMGACGLALGFACQGLLSSVEVDSNRLIEENLLRDVIKNLIMVLSELCPHASDSLQNLIEYFLLDGHDSVEASSLLPQWKLDSFEEEPWGVAGIVLGLGICVVAMHRLGLNDAILIMKDILLSWIPSLESSKKSSLIFNELTDISLAVGACLAIPIVVAFCQNVDLMIGKINTILIRYVSLVSELLNSKESGIHYQNLRMASCVGVGSFVSCILNYGVHSIRYDDIKILLEDLRNGYTASHPPIVQLGAMIGVVNAFGAAAGDLTDKHLQDSFLPVSLDRKGSDFVRGPIILSPTCENLSTSFVQELFFVAKESKDQQIRKHAAWAVAFLRQKWCSKTFQEIECSKGIPMPSALQSQSVPEDSIVWKLCSWLSNINFHQVHSSTVVSVLRCLSKAPRLPVLDWASIIRGLMKNAANFAKKSQIMQDVTSFQEECIYFSLTCAKDVKSLLLFLDDFTDLVRFRTLDLNLQCLLLRNVSDLMSSFSTSRMERLFEDFVHFFSSSTSPYFVYGSKQQVLLRISFWKGLYQCLNGANVKSSCLSQIERCMDCLFRLMPSFVYNVKSAELWSICSEWSEGIRCLTKARHGWLMDILQFSGKSTFNEISMRILAKIKLVKNGGLSFSELEKLKSYILNFRLEGMWWTLLVELVAALFIAEASIKRQWLLDALDVSCVTANPLTAISFIGLLSGSCCKYMPLLIVEPEIVLNDLPMTLPSLLSSSGWSVIAESSVHKLWLSTERICTWAAATLSRGAIDNFPDSNYIDVSDVDTFVSLARLMHRTCLSLKDYLPLDQQLRLANIEVP